MKRLVLALGLAACQPTPANTSVPAVTVSNEVSVPPAQSLASASDATNKTSNEATPTPISGQLPVGMPAQLVMHTSCTRQACPKDTLQLSEAPDEDASPGWLTSIELNAGATLSLPENMDITVYGVVLEGAVRLGTKNATDGISSRPVRTWHAFRAPGAHIDLTATQPSSLVLGMATNGEPLAKAIQTPPTAGRTPRPSTIEVVDIAKRRDLAWAGGAMHGRIIFDEGRASVQVLLGSADVGVPPHVHRSSWEVVGLLEADGVFRLGDRTSKVSTGSILAIPSGVSHQFAPSKTHRLVAVQLYVPPGPEQRFKTLSEP